MGVSLVVPSLGTLDQASLLGTDPRQETLPDGLEQSRWQEARGSAFRPLRRRGAQVGTGPDEVVAFVQRDPGALAIESETRVGLLRRSIYSSGGWGAVWVTGRTMTRVRSLMPSSRPA